MNFVTWVVSQAWIIILTSARISSEYITPSYFKADSAANRDFKLFQPTQLDSIYIYM